MNSFKPIMPSSISEANRNRFKLGFKSGSNKECWDWIGYRKLGSPYGSFFMNGSYYLAHRISYALENGIIDVMLCICHSCDNPLCVNPEHLWEGSHADNNKDMLDKGRHRTLRGKSMSMAMEGRAACGLKNGAYTHPDKIPKGMAHPFSKLSDEDVIEIRRLCGTGLFQSSVAASYGIHKATVNDIIRGKSWKHLK